MTGEEIIKLAREAGVIDRSPFVEVGPAMMHAIGLFAALVAAAEREACAKVCAELAHKQRDYMLFEDADGCDLCAAEIRARGEK